MELLSFSCYYYLCWLNPNIYCLLVVMINCVAKNNLHYSLIVTHIVRKDDGDSAIRTYHFTSQRWFAHASPTLSNAGTARLQVSDDGLVCMKEDSI
ncbi:unnamed protein product [Musa textilis]